MGSPIFPILADLVTQDLETNVLEKFDFNIPVYYRHVIIFYSITFSKQCLFRIQYFRLLFYENYSLFMGISQFAFSYVTLHSYDVLREKTL